MIRPQFLLVSLLVANTAAADAVDPRPPAPPAMPAGEGRQLYDKAIDAMPRGCATEDTAAKRTRLAEFERALAAATDPANREKLRAWVGQTRAWLDANAAGIPGAGTWEELAKLTAEIDAGLALWNRLPAEVPVGIEKTKEKVDGFIVLKALVAKSYVADKVVNHTTCEAFAKDFYARMWKFQNELTQLPLQVNQGVESALLAVSRWQGPGMVPAGAPPVAYWDHVTYVFKGVEAIKATRAVAAKLETAVLWMPLLAADKAATLKAAPEQLAKALAEWEPKIAAELAAVEMPPMGKDAARSKTLVRALAGSTTGKQIGSITTGGAASKESWTQQVVVARETNGVWVKDVKNNRDYYSVYYGWKPTLETSTAADLPGLAKADICELWAMGFARSSQGRQGPSGAFSPTDSWVVGYLPCANLTKTSKKKP